MGTLKRDGKTWIASASDEIRRGDFVSLLGRPGDVEEIKKTFTKGDAKHQFIVIAGGGETGYHLAPWMLSAIACCCWNTIRSGCDYLASHLTRATVVCADALAR
ncbi:MAG: hypothetical protein R3C56_33265 [Pirellulaceae bacterium]